MRALFLAPYSPKLGNSTIGTREFLQKESAAERPWKLVLLQDPRCNVARGINLAIAAAGFEIIASTDIGCEWDPEWLEEQFFWDSFKCSWMGSKNIQNIQ